MNYTGRAQCLIVRDNKILMAKHQHSENEWNYCLPGGRIETGETPEQAAIRELKEECNVNGRIIKKVSEYVDSFDFSIYTFQVNIGEQNPMLGTDPEILENPVLVEVKWLSLYEICERDRAFLWAAGLISSTYFTDELLSWSKDISYPAKIE